MCQSVCLSVCLSVSVDYCLTIYISTCQSVCQPLCLFLCLSLCLSLYLFVCGCRPYLLKNLTTYVSACAVLRQTEVAIAAGLYTVMTSDALASSHPMTADVETRQEISSIFDDVTYTKVQLNSFTHANGRLGMFAWCPFILSGIFSSVSIQTILLLFVLA